MRDEIVPAKIVAVIAVGKSTRTNQGPLHIPAFYAVYEGEDIEAVKRTRVPMFLQQAGEVEVRTFSFASLETAKLPISFTTVETVGGGDKAPA